VRPRVEASTKPLSKASLERSALWHLGRRALTVDELRTRLEKKAKRHPPCADAPAWIDALLVRLAESLLVDDRRVAEARVHSGRARGLSKRRIEQKLRGVDEDVRAAAFNAVDVDADAELAAARTFAQKKKLHQKDRQKALASLARQGFSFAVAKRALEASDLAQRTTERTMFVAEVRLFCLWD
jgi:regulatory protein